MVVENIIEATGLTKSYYRGAEEVKALNSASFAVKQGEIVAITGPSGSGKTTLVNIVGCLDNPTSGSLKVGGEEIFKPGLELSETKLTAIRSRHFGYVFQRFFLIPTLTVRENIMLPSVFQKSNRVDESALNDIMKLLGIEKRTDHLPAQLSGGEMQRVAIARALINNPSVLIADEPTGNLDSRRSDEVKELLMHLNKNRGLTILLVTHNPDMAAIGHQSINLLDGVIQ